MVGPLETMADVVGVEDSMFTDASQFRRTMGSQIGVGSHEDAAVAKEGSYFSNAQGPVGAELKTVF
tara:strand:+ start:302 stop:499 length:198 start_codon:yes stop_codon:yes gene_type:complete